ncbi:hypothetical protein AMAG_10028 [Allomyces macrogynus ATCC 38327]|uniref:UBA domain-containing protein n=1 Tax=Allomyces macrogynus (strain ATCC 38327) TaxID=578462 RepID=A0A0L0SQM0_ALLM3|nr:hypothetical protein AMAG_10028 [Allomyces macrogynus ATCC 38327]|eukprot:KNE64674.1 hypothetical protein AMAG_10028 [Allomyces macrogynus ATCC 38327]
MTQPKRPLPDVCPARITLHLPFAVADDHYVLTATFPKGCRPATRLAALMIRHAVPVHLLPSLRDQVARAVLDAQRALGPPSSVSEGTDLGVRVAHLAALYDATTPTDDPPVTADTDADDEDAFASAFQAVIHAPVPGLLDAVLGLQVRYAAAHGVLASQRDAAIASANTTRRASALVDVPTSNPSAAGTRARSASNASARSAPDLDAVRRHWRAEMKALARAQRAEFRTFVRAVARVLKRDPGIEYRALIAAVFDEEVHSEEQSGRTRRHSMPAQAAVPVAAVEETEEDRAAARRRTLRKSASTELLRLVASAGHDEAEATAAKEPAPVPDQGPSPPQPSADDDPVPPDVAQITEMGFSRHEAAAALRLSDHNVERALGLLLENPDRVQRYLARKRDRHERAATAPAPAPAPVPAPVSASPPVAASAWMPSLRSHLEALLQEPEPEPSPAVADVPALTDDGAGSQWLPFKFLQTEVQGKLTGWLGGALRPDATGTSPPSGPAGPSSLPPATSTVSVPPTPGAPPAGSVPLLTESFDVLLGAQLKMPFIVTVILAPTWRTYLVPPTAAHPPAANTDVDLAVAWGEAIAVRSAMAIDLYRHLRVLVQPYAPGTRLKDVARASPVAKAAEASPELVFPDLTAQLRRAAGIPSTGGAGGRRASVMTIASIDGPQTALAVTDDAASSILGAPAADEDDDDAFGTVYVTRHANLACANTVAHLLPTAPPTTSTASSNAPTAALDPATAHLFAERAPWPVPRIEAVAKAVRAALLDRARRVAGVAAGTSVGSVPETARLEGGAVTLVCMSQGEWDAARAAVVGVFRTA